jgi:hypothetical protein
VTEHEQMVVDCEAREGRLSDWERKFIDDMERILRNGGTLTHGQGEKLEEVWERVT